MTASTPSPTAPEHVQLDCDTLGGHAMHWQALTEQPEQDVTTWLQRSIDDAFLPRGLSPDESTQHWLILGPDQPLQVAQILDIENDQPTRLRTAFPYVDSTQTRAVRVKRVLHCDDTLEAVLALETHDGIPLYAFDSLYSVNQGLYEADQLYVAHLGALAYDLESVPEQELIEVTDPVAIRHHRALNDILTRNNGKTPDDLQTQLDAWQPSSLEDEAPVTLDISSMIAYLHGDQFGQEDEAWFQGRIIGAQPLQFFDRQGQILDVAILPDEDQHGPLVVQIAHVLGPDKNFAVGDKIRGNIWLQAALHAPAELS